MWPILGALFLLFFNTASAAFFDPGFTLKRPGEGRVLQAMQQIQVDLLLKESFGPFDLYQFGVISFYRFVLSSDDITLDRVDSFNQRSFQVEKSVARPMRFTTASKSISRETTPLGRGSGVFLNSSYFMTAGHVALSYVPRSMESANIVYSIYGNGKIWKANLDKGNFGTNRSAVMQEDWAILKLEEDESLPIAELEIAEPRIGDPVVFFGYPNGKVGLGNDYRIQNCDTMDVETRRAKTALPIPFYGVIASDEKVGGIQIVIKNGSEVAPGNSGGPVFTLNGKLLGVIVTLARTLNSDEVEPTGFFPAVKAYRRYKEMGGELKLVCP